MSCFACIFFFFYLYFCILERFKNTVRNAISLQPKRNIVKYCEGKKKNNNCACWVIPPQSFSPHISQTHTHKTPDSFILKFSSFFFSFFLIPCYCITLPLILELCVLASAFPSDVIQSLNLGYTMSLHQRQNIIPQICRIILTFWSFFLWGSAMNETDRLFCFLCFVFLQVAGYVFLFSLQA